MSRILALFAPLALLAAACGPSSASVPQNDAGGQDRPAQHDVALDTLVQEDAPVQDDAGTQGDAGPAVLYTDIRALQQDPTYVGTLAPLGSRVRIEGAVVTASSATASTFFIQNATGPKEYSGILVKKSAVVATMPTVGDLVTAIEATLIEESRSCNVDANVCPTRHALSGVTLFTVTAGAGTVPAPLALSTTLLKATPAKYDGVLVQLNDSPLTVTAGTGAGASMTITVAANVALYTYYYAPPGLPPAGTVITTAIGVVDIYGTGWEIYPRSNADLVFQDWPPDGGVQSDSGQTDSAGQQDGTFAGDAAPCGVDTIVISQIYGGGGNAGPPAATFTADFVELFNRGTATVDVGAWTVQYSSDAGSSWGSQKVALTGKSIPAGGYLLVQMNNAGATGAALPTPDVSGTNFNMSASAGKVALVKSSTSLTGTCPTSADIVDLVGYGSSANCFEGAKGPGGANDKAVIRDAAGCQDFNSNSYDFSAATPTPRNSATTPAPCGC